MKFVNKDGLYIVAERMQDEDIVYRLYSPAGEYLDGGTEAEQDFLKITAGFRRVD